MQFTTALTLLMGAITVSATPTPAVANSSSDADSMVILSNNWRMETWSGTSCTGTHLFWTAPDGGSCTNMAAVSSLRVTNFGGCSTTYYTGSGCQGSPVHVDTQGSCDGYTQGERIGSFSVNC